MLFSQGLNRSLSSRDELGKTAKKPTVMSISPWIGRQTVVSAQNNICVLRDFTLKRVRYTIDLRCHKNLTISFPLAVRDDCFIYDLKLVSLQKLKQPSLEKSRRFEDSKTFCVPRRKVVFRFSFEWFGKVDQFFDPNGTTHEINSYERANSPLSASPILNNV